MSHRATPWTETSIGEAVRRLTGDETRMRQGFWAKIRRLAGRLPFAEDLLAAYYCAFDRDTPAHVKASLLAALGFADDAAVLAAALRLMAAQIRPEHRAAARQALARGQDAH
jgi:uncharacterized membrane protein YkvA (DUF1232 family)